MSINRRGFPAAMAALTGLALHAGCADLPDVARGVCGNSVIDPGEDCDTFATQPGTSCRPPGSSGQCRYACVSGSTPHCPSGMGCGSDGTCRAASGRFVSTTNAVPGDFLELLTADVDGDGRADVLSLDPVRVGIHFFGGVGRAALDYPLSVPLDFPRPYPLLGDLSGDGRADLLTPAGVGTVIELGSAGRTLTPLASPTITVPDSVTDLDVVLMSVFPDQGAQPIGLGSLGGASALVVIDADLSLRLLALVPEGASHLAGELVADDFDENASTSPGQELVFGFVGQASITFFRPAMPDGKGGFAWNDTSKPQGAAPSSIALAGGAKLVRGPLAVDVNGDGHLDLVADAAKCSGCDAIQVAYGVGDGTFHSDPAHLPAASGDGKFAPSDLYAGLVPLAMGDLNRDGVADIVTPTSVLVSSVGPDGSTKLAEQAESGGPPWTEAVVADLNGNGIPDVLAASSTNRNITFFNGVGDARGSINQYDIPTDVPVAALTLGDYDGDLVNDVAVAELHPSTPTDTLGDSVSILFGAAVGAPAPPVSMGRFGPIRHLTSGFVGAGTVGAGGAAAGLLVDGISDLFAVTGKAPLEVGTFLGTSDRSLRSPLGLLTGVQTGTGVDGFAATRFATGTFVAHHQGHDVAMLATDLKATRLWLVTTNGDGRLDPVNATPSDVLDPSLDWSRAAIAAVDLDGDGIDEVVALGPSAKDDTAGLASVARVVASGQAHTFSVGAPAPTAAVVLHAESNTTTDPDYRVTAVDLDRDGKKDVVAVARVAAQPGDTPSPHVVVFWNKATGALGPMTVVPDPPGLEATDFAVLHPRSGAALDLAVGTHDGVHLAHFDGRTPRMDRTPAIPGIDVRLLASGDVDGDGVDDLAVASSTAYVLFQGVPVLQ